LAENKNALDEKMIWWHIKSIDTVWGLSFLLIMRTKISKNLGNGDKQATGE